MFAVAAVTGSVAYQFAIQSRKVVWRENDVECRSRSDSREGNSCFQFAVKQQSYVEVHFHTFGIENAADKVEFHVAVVVERTEELWSRYVS